MKKLSTTILSKRWLLYLLVIILPFVLTIPYALTCKTDYHMAALVYGSDNLILDSFRTAGDYYKNWNGMFPYIFLECALNPLNYAKAYDHLVGVQLLIFFFVFIVTLYFYVKEFLGFFFDITDRRCTHALYLCTLMAFLNADFYRQIFYWFVGGVAYLLSTVFIMMSQICMMRWFRKRTLTSAVLLSITGFIGCFNYQLGIFSGIIYLLCMFKTCKKIEVKDLIPLAFMIAGGLTSLLAPGNVVRYNSLDQHISLLALLGVTVGNVVSSIGQVVTSPLFVVYIAVCVYAGYRCHGKNNALSLYRILGYVFFLPGSLFGILFPLALGNPEGDLPSRIRYMVDLVIIIWSLFISLSLGNIMKSKLPLVPDLVGKVFKAACLIMTIILVVKLPLPWYYTMSNLKTIRNESNYYSKLYKVIYYSPDQDVEITISDSIAKSGILIFPFDAPGGSGELTGYSCKVLGKDSVTVIKR